MKISIPELSLVVLIGSSGSGKSTFARRHFLPTEIISSDHCRALVSDDENSMEATESAFAVLHFIAAERLKRGKLTVIDATNVQKEARASLLALAKTYHCLAVAVVLNTPERICHERNASRPDRNFGPHVVRRHCNALKRSLRFLSKEGFRYVHVLSVEEADEVEFERQPLWNNRKSDHGPFDIIGDVHGCADELELLLQKLGYQNNQYDWHHPDGRRVIFVGDLVDRGPRSMDVLQIAMTMTAAGNALCVPGNHDAKFLKYLQGRRVRVQHGLQQTIEQLESTFSAEEQIPFKEKTQKFLDGLISHYVLDDGDLVVAHAGLKAEMQGRASGAVRSFALFGDVTGDRDDDGLPVRLDWAQDYRGKASVVYGHTPVAAAEWRNNTINIDTGCVFGGALTALRWPERELISVPAGQTYAEPARPLAASASPDDDIINITDVSGKRIVNTRLMGNITIREENAMAALEVMSRFAAPPQWLIYLPPTMSPCATSSLPGTLEHPAEAFDYFRERHVPQIICEEKHMGSRAVIVVCRDVPSAQKRFGIQEDRSGIIFTRTGRPFFTQANLENEVLSLLQQVITKADLWNELKTDWLCIDAEVMPWSLKAAELIRRQYAPVAVAAREALRSTSEVLSQAAQSGLDVSALQEKYQRRQEMIERYERVTKLYNWQVDSVHDLRLAAFHLLASEGQVHLDKNHLWHLAQLQKLVDADASKVLFPTAHRVVTLGNEDEERAAIDWWEEITAAGSEGMVVKPLDFVAPNTTSLIQPAVKCRGREYLRLIYGPEYDEPQYLEHLRRRGLGHKRSMAAREFSLGVEALERFVTHQPLSRVHECVFAVLAMESEPVDPRL